MAARSPARSTAGPDVVCRWASSSVAMMPASVVLPRPGGPENSRWSGDWPRRRAASSTMSRWAFSSDWPTNSASRRGRRVVSAAPSSALSSGSGSGSSSSSRIGRSPRPHRGEANRCSARRSMADGVPVVGQLGRGRPDLVGPVAQAGQGLAHVGGGRALGRGQGPARRSPRWGPPRCRGCRAATSARRAAGRRSSCRRPAPGTARRRRRRPGCARSAAGAWTDRMASAIDGPTPWAPSSASNVTFSSRVPKPYSVSASSRRWWCTHTNASSPTSPTATAVVGDTTTT